MRAHPFCWSGVGVHDGQLCNVTACPVDHLPGPVFTRAPHTFRPAVEQLAPETRRATDLLSGQARLRTVEHFLAALCAAGLPGLELQVDGDELPILDGSASPVFQALRGAGLRAPFAFVELLAEVEIGCDDAVARLRPLSKSEEPWIRVELELGPEAPRFEPVVFHPTRGDFATDIAPARTFTRMTDIETLRGAGLIRGGSLECALVLDKHGPIRGQQLRLPDEPVRHKLLDAIGDLALLGGMPWAAIELYRPGHRLLHEVAKAAAPLVRAL